MTSADASGIAAHAHGVWLAHDTRTHITPALNDSPGLREILKKK